jgi:hypothetical protein
MMLSLANRKFVAVFLSVALIVGAAGSLYFAAVTKLVIDFSNLTPVIGDPVGRIAQLRYAIFYGSISFVCAIAGAWALFALLRTEWRR